MMKSDSKDTIEVIFERAIEIEYKLAYLYKEFTQLFSHIQDISVFWKGLTADEVKHAKTLKDVRKALTHEQLLSSCDKEILEKIAGIQRLQSEILSKSVKNLDDAYELAHELEFSEINAVFKLLATEFVPSEKRKQFVASEIEQHQQKLMDFSHNFGDRVWRKKINIHDV